MASPQQKLYVKSGGGGRALCRSRISCVSADSVPLRIPALHIVPSVSGQCKRRQQKDNEQTINQNNIWTFNSCVDFLQDDTNKYDYRRQL